MGIRALLVAAVILLAGSQAADAAPVRIFAVGNKQRMQDAVSHAAYHDKMAALMDAGFPNRGSFVQSGVDDVASHLRPSDPRAPGTALVTFPEDVGLVAGLIGSRGAGARIQGSTFGAIFTLLGAYGRQYSHYTNKFPQAGVSIGRPLALALTDTLYRSFYETFRALAIEHGVYISATMNAAPARKVTAAADPALFALLSDPDEPDRDYVYDAVSPFPGNSTYVFDPDGEVLVPDGNGGTLRSPSETGGVIRPSLTKAYLTQPEQPPPGEFLGLGLGFGAVNEQEVIDTPAGRLGIVISKDAWMVDVNDRLAAKGANVMLQPEAFSDWAYVASPWAPDIFKEGGFANLQKLPQFKVNVNASLTGNFLDLTFDGQSAILGRKQKADPGPKSGLNSFIGQNPDTGFLAVAPWIEPDPGIANPSLSLAQRRAMLAADGAKLAPTSAVPCPDTLAVGACRNGYRESIVWADVEIPDGPVTAPVDRRRSKAPKYDWSTRVSGREPIPVAQHAPDVAADGPRVYAVWHEARAGLESVFLSVSKNGGRRFGEPIKVSANPAGSVAEMFPSVAAEGKQVAVAWQEFASGRDDSSGRVKLARFDFKGRKLGRDVRVDDTNVGGKWLPQVTLVDGRPIVAWIDERDRGFEGEPLEHVYAARGLDSGRGFEPSVRVDGGDPVPLSAHLDNKWSPTIAESDGRVYVAWADFRNYNWDIFMARSDDAGRSFGTNTRVDDFPDYERINERPALGIGPSGVVHAAWTDLRAREADTNVVYSRSSDFGASFPPARQLDDSKAGFDPDRDTPTNQWHPSLAAAGERLYVAWQDNRLGNNDIFFTESANGGSSFGPSERVDDTGTGSSEQSRPQLAWAHDTCYVAWEDDRNGTSDIYLARRRCR